MAFWQISWVIIVFARQGVRWQAETLLENKNILAGDWFKFGRIHKGKAAYFGSCLFVFGILLRASDPALPVLVAGSNPAGST